MSEARIIDGKAFAAGLRARIAEDVAKLKALHRLQPGLAVVLVGEDPASQIYVTSKGQQTKEAGMHSEEHRLPADASLDQIVALVKTLNADRNIHGILVQLPLPNGLDPAPVIAAIDPDNYSKPWTAAFTLKKQPGYSIEQYSCMADHKM